MLYKIPAVAAFDTQGHTIDRGACVGTNPDNFLVFNDQVELATDTAIWTGGGHFTDLPCTGDALAVTHLV